MSEKENEKDEKEPTKEGIRDLDFREDFDPQTGELKNDEMQKFYAAERQALLGKPVGSEDATQGYADAPPVIEKAAPDEKVVLVKGDSADILAARYSKKQLTDYADAHGVEYAEKDSKLSIAIEILKGHKWDEDTDKQTALNTLPAAPEINDAEKGK